MAIYNCILLPVNCHFFKEKLLFRASSIILQKFNNHSRLLGVDIDLLRVPFQYLVDKPRVPLKAIYVCNTLTEKQV